jgi:hypothetical protein
MMGTARNIMRSPPRLWASANRAGSMCDNENSSSRPLTATPFEALVNASLDAKGPTRG